MTRQQQLRPLRLSISDGVALSKTLGDCGQRGARILPVQSGTVVSNDACVTVLKMACGGTCTAHTEPPHSSSRQLLPSNMQCCIGFVGKACAVSLCSAALSKLKPLCQCLNGGKQLGCRPVPFDNHYKCDMVKCFD